MGKKKELQIIYEDDYIVAVNKPPRINTVPAKDVPLSATILGKMPNRYILHRLDYETSGVLLFGKSERDRHILEGILRHSDTRKKYIALVKNVPHGGSVGRMITKVLHARDSKEDIPAKTFYRVTKVFRFPGAPVFSLVEAEIKTGRRHQVRQHLAMIGHPIIMDNKYGDQHLNRAFRLRLRLGRLFLHSAEISFFHPILKKQTTITAPLPPDLQSVIKKLNFAR